MQILLELSFYEVTAEPNWHRKATCSDSSRLRQVTEKICINYLPAYQNTVHDIRGYHSLSVQCIELTQLTRNCYGSLWMKASPQHCSEEKQ